MRHNTMRILIAVAIAGLLGIAGNVFLASRITSVTDQYNVVADIYLTNEEYVAELKGDIYYIQSLISNHVVNTEEAKYDAYEAEITRMDAEIRAELRDFSERLEEPEDAEMLHQVANNYYAFYSQSSVVIKLSREGTKQSAEYYVCNEMADFIVEANVNLENLNLLIKDEMQEANDQLLSSLRSLNTIKYYSIALVVLASVLGSVIVAVNARKILERQSDTEQKHQQEVMMMQQHVIAGLANLIESRDGETGLHVKRTSDYVAMITHRLREKSTYSEITDEFEELIFKAAPLHDIGKIKVPDTILKKPGKLTAEEFEIIKTHASEGGNIVYGILKGIEKKEYLDMAHDVATYHHEKWDGSGYPEGLAGTKIPLCARIMAVADVFDALISKRCYKEAFPLDEAYQIIASSSGSHFDPEIVNVFMEMRTEMESYLSN